jgi:hypothetical protein
LPESIRNLSEIFPEKSLKKSATRLSAKNPLAPESEIGLISGGINNYFIRRRMLAGTPRPRLNRKYEGPRKSNGESSCKIKKISTV